MTDIACDTEDSVCPPVMQHDISRLYLTTVSYLKVLRSKWSKWSNPFYVLNAFLPVSVMIAKFVDIKQVHSI